MIHRVVGIAPKCCLLFNFAACAWFELQLEHQQFLNESLARKLTNKHFQGCYEYVRNYVDFTYSVDMTVLLFAGFAQVISHTLQSSWYDKGSVRIRNFNSRLSNCSEKRSQATSFSSICCFKQFKFWIKLVAL